MVFDKAASPRYGLLEAKCSYSVFTKSWTCKEAATRDSNFCLQDCGSQLRLKRDHPYYYQVQGQLAATLLRGWAKTRLLSVPSSTRSSGSPESCRSCRYLYDTCHTAPSKAQSLGSQHTQSSEQQICACWCSESAVCPTTLRDTSATIDC